MRVKACAIRANQPKIKVVMIKQDDKYITHIYHSRDCFRLDKLARYKQKAFKTLVVTASTSTTKKNGKVKP